MKADALQENYTLRLASHILPTHTLRRSGLGNLTILYTSRPHQQIHSNHRHSILISEKTKVNNGEERISVFSFRDIAVCV